MPVPKRPIFLNLLQIHLPLMGWVSILHRLTGVLLFVFMPLPLWLLQHSLQDAVGFTEVTAWLSNWPLQLFLLLMLWWFWHHLFAGIRFLLLDMELGVELEMAKISAAVLLLFDLVFPVAASWWWL